MKIECRRHYSDTIRKPEEKRSEEQLFMELRTIKNNFENTKLNIYHTIGTRISQFYGKIYGENVMGRIAKTLDLSTSTVYKIAQFAEKYDQQDVNKISEGPFQLSWHRLRDNLSLDKDEIFKAYQASHNPAEFSRRIKEVKRKFKLKEESDDQAIELSENCPGEANFQGQPLEDSPTEAVANLQAEITRLQSELDQKGHQLETLHTKIELLQTDWIKGFPDMLRDLNKETLQSLEGSLVEELNRRKVGKVIKISG